MKYFIILLLLLPGLDTIAQESVKGSILEINPTADGFTKTRLPFGSFVKFKITNVNPFKIEGTNSISKESISFEVPAQISQQLTQASETDLKEVITQQETKIENLQNDIYSFNENPYKNKFFNGFPSNSTNAKANKNEDIILALKNQIAGLKQYIDSLKKDLQLRDSIYNLKSTFINNYTGFVSNLNKLSLYISVDAYIDSLLQETFIIDTTTLKSNLTGYMSSINDDETNIQLLRGKCLRTLQELDRNYLNAKGAYDELAKKVKNEKVAIGDVKTKDNTATLKFDSVNIIFVREKIFEKEFQFLTAKYDTLNSNDKRTSIINKTNAGIDYYHRVQNAKFEVYTDAQQLNNDKITITPKLKNAKGDIIKEYNPVEIKTFGGWKVDVSTGYLLSFKSDENYTNLYDDEGLSGVQKNSSENLKHTIGALFNAYRRTGRDVNFGLSLGFSIPTDGSSIGFYGGGSILFLEKNRLVMTIGVAENRVRILNTGNLVKDNIAGKLSEKETYKFSNVDFKEIKYDNAYKPAFFIGISYNLFTIKKAE